MGEFALGGNARVAAEGGRGGRAIRIPPRQALGLHVAVGEFALGGNARGCGRWSRSGLGTYGAASAGCGGMGGELFVCFFVDWSGGDWDFFAKFVLDFCAL